MDLSSSERVVFSKLGGSPRRLRRYREAMNAVLGEDEVVLSAAEATSGGKGLLLVTDRRAAFLIPKKDKLWQAEFAMVERAEAKDLSLRLFGSTLPGVGEGGSLLFDLFLATPRGRAEEMRDLLSSEAARERAATDPEVAAEKAATETAPQKDDPPYIETIVPTRVTRSADMGPSERVVFWKLGGSHRRLRRYRDAMKAVLGEDEVVLSAAEATSGSKKGLLMVTERRVAFLMPKQGKLWQAEFPMVERSEVDDWHLRLFGPRLPLAGEDGSLLFPAAAADGSLLFDLFLAMPIKRAEEISDLISSEAAREKAAIDPLYKRPVLAHYSGGWRGSSMSLYDDPPCLEADVPSSRTSVPRPIVEGVHAIVETVGGISTTRGRDLAQKALGGVLLPGLGLFLAGNAKENIKDWRELYLLVEGPDWADTWPLDPEKGAEARQFAQAINLAARRARATERPRGADDEAPPEDPLSSLERLARLRDSGALTEAQFEAQKVRVLARM